MNPVCNVCLFVGTAGSVCAFGGFLNYFLLMHFQPSHLVVKQVNRRNLATTDSEAR